MRLPSWLLIRQFNGVVASHSKGIYFNGDFHSAIDFLSASPLTGFTFLVQSMS